MLLSRNLHPTGPTCPDIVTVTWHEGGKIWGAKRERDSETFPKFLLDVFLSVLFFFPFLFLSFVLSFIPSSSSMPFFFPLFFFFVVCRLLLLLRFSMFCLSSDPVSSGGWRNCYSACHRRATACSSFSSSCSYLRLFRLLSNCRYLGYGCT